jgi:hypothetical protein
MGEQLCRTPEQFKAWSQNLGHEGVLTTLFAYGTVPVGRQREIIANFGVSAEGSATGRGAASGASNSFA